MTRDEFYGRLLLAWSRTIEVHKIGSFDEWLKQQHQPKGA